MLLWRPLCQLKREPMVKRKLNEDPILALEELTDAAIKVQASIRGFFAKRKYKLTHKAIDSCTNYNLFVRGNDPEIHCLPRHSSSDKVLLIGTSGLRTLEIACQLGSAHLKILLLDNSRHVIQFWRGLQRLMKDATSEIGILDRLAPITCPCSQCMASNKADTQYFASLCLEHGFDKIKHMILHASIIPQDLGNKETFRVISNLVAYHQYQGVYAYLSNIVAYVANTDEASAKGILENIALLNPTLAIHTDLAGRRSPENVFHCSENNHDSEEILPALTASFHVKSTLKPKAVFSSDRVEILSMSV
jgi:hypothetical protein